MKVDSLEDTSDYIKELSDQFGGYVSNQYEYGVDNNKSVSITVRVPVKRFDTFLTELKDLAVEVTSTYENTADVTEEYIDLEARLTNKRAVEEQYLALLEKAVDVEDMLLIQEQLGYVRGEIESLESQIKYYDSQTEYSTISINLSLSSEGTEVVDESWDPLGTVKDAAGAFVGLLRAAGNVIIWLVVFSPVVIIPVLLVKVGKKKKK
jgi:hypothetical protein